MTDYAPQTSRRHVLQGIGAAVSLPFLPSLDWLRDRKMDKQLPPRRLATMIFANGVNVHHWTQELGPGNRIGKVGSALQPLVPFHDEVLYLNNLRLFEETPGIHRLYFDNFLAGMRYKPKGLPNLMESLDWRVARQVAKTTPVPVLVLSGNGGQTMSWSSPTTPVPPETLPQRAFDRLFDTSALERDRSVLDYVNTEAKRLRTDLDSVDQHKLDEYLESIWEIERRIELATSDDRHAGGWTPSLDEPSIERPEAGRSDHFGKRIELLLDIAVLALQMDKTRVVNFIFENDVGGQKFDFIKGVSGKGMHDISHHRSRADELEDYRRVNLWHVEQFAKVITKMKGINEGHGTTLFDNTILLFGTTMRDGDIHDHQRCPLVLAGGKSAGIKGGRVLNFEKDEDRRLCNLHLDLAHRMGCTDWTEFGNSHYRLPGIGG
jgi:hypothetical protein